MEDFGFNNKILVLFFLRWAEQIYSKVVILSIVIQYTHRYYIDPENTCINIFLF